MTKEDPTGVEDCQQRAGRCQEWKSSDDNDKKSDSTQTFLVTPGGQIDKLVRAAAAGDNGAADKLRGAGVTGFTIGGAAYDLQSSMTIEASSSNSEGRMQTAQNNAPGKMTYQKLSAKYEHFFNSLYGPTFALSKRLNVFHVCLLGLAAVESLWYSDPHDVSLNNPFGLTQAGGRDLHFKSVDDAVQNWAKNEGSRFVD